MPQQPFEGRLVDLVWLLENHRQAAQPFRVVAIAIGPFKQAVVNPQIVPSAAHVVGDDHVEHIAGLC